MICVETDSDRAIGSQSDQKSAAEIVEDLVQELQARSSLKTQQSSSSPVEEEEEEEEDRTVDKIDNISGPDPEEAEREENPENATSNADNDSEGNKKEDKKKKSSGSTKKKKRHKNKHKKKKSSKGDVEVAEDKKQSKHKKSKRRSKSSSASPDEIVEWVELEVKPQISDSLAETDKPVTATETTTFTVQDPLEAVEPAGKDSQEEKGKEDKVEEEEKKKADGSPKAENHRKTRDKKDVHDGRVSTERDKEKEKDDRETNRSKSSKKEDGDKDRHRARSRSPSSSGHRSERSRKRDDRHSERSRSDRRGDSHRYSPAAGRSRRRYGSSGRSRSRSRSGSRKRDHAPSLYYDRRMGYGRRRNPETKRDRSVDRITSLVNKQAEAIEKKLLADKLLTTTVKKPEGFIFTAAESKTKPGEAVPAMEASRASNKTVESGAESKPADAEDSSSKVLTQQKAVVEKPQATFDLRQKLLNMARPKTSLEQDVYWKRQQQQHPPQQSSVPQQWPPTVAGMAQYWGYGVPPATPEAAWAAYNAYSANGTMGQKPMWDPSWYGTAAGANWYNWGWGDAATAAAAAGGATGGGPTAEAYAAAQAGSGPYYWDGVTWRRNPQADEGTAAGGRTRDDSESDAENDVTLRPPGCESDEETAKEAADVEDDKVSVEPTEEVNCDNTDRDRESEQMVAEVAVDAAVVEDSVQAETEMCAASVELPVNPDSTLDEVSVAEKSQTDNAVAETTIAVGEIDVKNALVPDTLMTQPEEGEVEEDEAVPGLPDDTTGSGGDGDVDGNKDEEASKDRSVSPSPVKKHQSSKSSSKRTRSKSGTAPGSKAHSKRSKRSRRSVSNSKSRSRSPSKSEREKKGSYGRTRKYPPKSRRSRSRSRSRRRSHSRTPTSASVRSKRERSRSHSQGRKSRSHSRGRRSSRSPPARPRNRDSDGPRSSARSRRSRRSRSGSSDDDRIDKAKLLEIARRNALTLMAEGKIPPSLIAEAKRKPDPGASKASAKSVQELTDFCKHLSKLEKAEEEGGGQSQAKNTGGDDEEEEGKPFINHPFKVRDVKPIVFSGRSVTNKPIAQNSTGNGEKPQLRLQFPVSSGTQHKHTWELVVPDETAAKPTVVEELQEPVYVEPKPPINIGSVVSERLKAVRKLQENPLDVEALTQIHKVQQQMQSWAKSKQLPGQFTGSTGLRLLTPEQLAGPKHSQAWVKKDLFIRAAPVAGGVGMNLLRKMGWNPGEGLGKNKEGSVEPLKLDIKMDKKGLVSVGELPRKSKNSLAKDISAGKHPISMLVELCNRQQWQKPEFEMIHDSGPDHKKNFLFKAVVCGLEYQPAVASLTKKQAKAQAALATLQALGVLPANYNTADYE